MLELHPGERVAGFDVKQKIGQGGMGAVYLVYDRRLAVDRALKVISIPPNDRHPEATRLVQERFFREARTLAKLRHPHIIPVHLVDEHNGHPYLVMDYFPSRDMKAWNAMERPSLERIRDVGRQMAGALAYAHKEGVLHRDLKLGNVLVSPRDVVQIVDFGLAKSTTDVDLTRTGMSLGTHSYYAPEYVASAMKQRAEHTTLTDLWAVGCILYALAAHRPVFYDKEEMRLLGLILEGKYLPVDAIRTDISDDFAAVIHGLLQRDPKKRIQSADQLLARLNAVDEATDPEKPPFSYVGPLPGPAPSANAKTVVASPQRQKASLLAAPPDSSIDDASGVFTDDPAQGGGSHASGGVDESAKTVRHWRAPGDPAAGGRARSSDDSGPSIDAALDRAIGPTVPAPLPRTGPVRHGVPSLSDNTLPHVALPAEGLPSQSPRAPAARRDVTTPPGAPDGISVLAAAMRGDRQPTDGPHVLPAQQVVDITEEAGAPVGDAETPSVGPLPAPAFSGPAAKPEAKRSALRNLLLPAIGAAVVLIVGGTFIELGGSMASNRSSPAAFVDPDLARKSQSAQAELADLEREKRETAVGPAAVAPTPAPLAPAPAAGSGTGPDAPGAALPGPRRKRTPAEPALQPDPTAAPAAAPSESDAFAARYGRRTDFNTTAVAAKPEHDDAATAAPGAGVRVPVRVDVALASSPAGPVIALVTAATKVGDVQIPAGAQLHGQTTGTSGSRLLVTFSFVVVNGKNVPLHGSALGMDGRAGVPGQKGLGGVSDVGAGALAGAIRGTGEVVAKAAGDNPVGEAVRGAMGPAASKGQRVNNEEELVTTKRGQRFLVYVEGA